MIQNMIEKLATGICIVTEFIDIQYNWQIFKLLVLIYMFIFMLPIIILTLILKIFFKGDQK